MYDLFVGAHLAGRAGHALAHSARPDSPVVAPPAERSAPRARVRAHVAASLHRLASALEPAAGRDRRVSPRVEPSSACR